MSRKEEEVIAGVVLIIRTPVYPGENRKFEGWFGKDAELSWKNVMLAYYLDRYADRGAFMTPGKYLLKVMRTGRWRRMKTEVYKWNDPEPVPVAGGWSVQICPNLART
jgi:hypothetical protein